MADRNTIADVETAIAAASTQYFSACRQRVPAFIKNHFQYPGAWQTNKRALGWDLLRAPLNLFWAPFYLVIYLTSLGLRKLNLHKASQFLQEIPSGFTTDIQRYLTQQTYAVLLGRDSSEENNDALFQLLQDNLSALADNKSGAQHTKQLDIQAIIHDALEQYGITRTASADIGNSLLSTIIGGFAFQKFTPGGFAIGIAIATWLAHRWAIDDFILGQWLGGLYYTIFPPTPSFGLSVISIVIVMAILSVFASFSGLITDPIQSWVGLHRRRLLKMLDQLEKDFLEQKVGGFRPKDQFVARLLELVDAVKIHVP